jgi:hypothetical protein
MIHALHRILLTTPRWTSRRGSFMTGCLVALGIVAVIVIGVGIWVAMNIRGWTAELARMGFTRIVQQSDLPAAQKPGIIAHVDALAEDFKQKRITLEDFTRIVEELEESPLLHIGLLYGAVDKFIRPSALSEQEKDRAVLDVQRLARGVHEERIPAERLHDFLDPLIDPQADTDLNLRASISQEQLRQFVAEAKAAADGAGVPEQPHEIDVAEELGKAIDRALGRGP